MILLMQATHKQWLFRNAHVHFCKLEGLTQAQHDEVFRQVLEMMEVDPEKILAKDRYLLEGNFHELGSTSTGARQTWLYSMELAMAAAEHVQLCGPIRGDTGTFNAPPPCRILQVRPSADGRIVFCIGNNTTRA